MVYPVRNKTKETPYGCLRQPVSNGVYLLIGQDIPAKEVQLRKIKQEFLPKKLQDFNLDTLYAKEATLKDIQERFLVIPFKSAKRIIVIKDADSLDEACRDFLSAYAKKPHKQLVLVLMLEHYDYQDGFIKNISRLAKVMRFKETVDPDTFALNRQIELSKADCALRLLNQLLKNGEAPERILGALRYSWEKQGIQSVGARRKLKLLLGCDVEIKTGRLKPAFALEKLVVGLCGFAQAAH
jgi:DNA polymerase III delta subunit